MSADPHVPSDDAAILRAHDRRFANAQKSFDRACRVCREHPNRWNIQAVTQAMLGLSDEYLAGLERKAGREPGSYPRLNEEIYPPQIRPPAVEAWEDGPCGAGMSDRVVVSRRVEAVPASAERSGLYYGTPGGRGTKSNDLRTTQPQPFNPMPLRTGNVLSEEERAARLRGITHAPDSPVAREFGRPIDPAAEQGDLA